MGISDSQGPIWWLNCARRASRRLIAQPRSNQRHYLEWEYGATTLIASCFVHSGVRLQERTHPLHAPTRAISLPHAPPRAAADAQHRPAARRRSLRQRRIWPAHLCDTQSNATTAVSMLSCTEVHSCAWVLQLLCKITESALQLCEMHIYIYHITWTTHVRRNDHSPLE
jgi:hypothetical protein